MLDAKIQDLVRAARTPKQPEAKFLGAALLGEAKWEAHSTR
jgi:hypothetical protein